ncbi:MAG: hypothetical protein U9O87_10315 [Verrucomicrobiota bacterium]|nr:hypothetical protein [Verrucomicrobiota bacterium]
MSNSKRKNKKEKICANPNCRRMFIPNKYPSGHQECCGAPACRRYMTNKRQKKFYALHSANSEWGKEHLERKKRERKERKRKDLALHSVSNISINLLKNESIGKGNSMLSVIKGILSYISGSTESKVISETFEQCFERGQMLLKKENDKEIMANSKFF